MWKGGEVFSKDDNDSAIGESPVNSAGEEAIYPRQKSANADGLGDQPCIYTQLNSKLGSHIPPCLLAHRQDLVRIEMNDAKTSHDVESISQNVEGFVGNSLTRKTIGPNGTLQCFGVEGSGRHLHHLLFEMKTLRQLDYEILQMFVHLNEKIDVMRLQVEQREAELLCTWDGEYHGGNGVRHGGGVGKVHNSIDDSLLVAPVSIALTSYATLTSTKTGPPSLSVDVPAAEDNLTCDPHRSDSASRSHSQPTCRHVDRRDSLKKIDPPALSSYRTKRLRSAKSREPDPKVLGPDPKVLGPDAKVRLNNKSSSMSKKSSPSLSKISNQEMKITSDFQKQRDYQKLLGLSLVQAGRSRVERRSSSQSQSVAISSLSVRHRRTNLSIDKNKSTNSSYSRLSKSIGLDKSHDRAYNVSGHSKVKEEQAVTVVSYKRLSNDAVHRWMENQDDVTYL